MTGVSYGQCELRHPWSIAFEPEGTARLHLVIRGDLWLHSANGSWEHLDEGDVVLLPQGPGHVLAGNKDTPAVSISDYESIEVADRVFTVRNAATGLGTIISCCSVGYDGPAIRSLTALMPEVLIVRREQDADQLLRALLNGMSEEVRRGRLGSATMLTRFADLVVGSIIRGWAETAPAGDSGWLSAVRDPNLGRAMLAIHAQPGSDWSVDRLAAEAGMSRSNFFARFTSTLGQTPARYLAVVRMGVATTMLRQSASTIADAAARLGYDSEASFSRAYKRVVGHSPSQARV